MSMDESESVATEPEPSTEVSEPKPRKMAQSKPKKPAAAKSPKSKSSPARTADPPPDTTGKPTCGPPAMRAAANRLRHIADPTRAAVVLILADGEMNVGDICTILDVSQPALSHHLALLRTANVVETVRSGKHVNYSLTKAGRLMAGLIKKLIA